MTTKPTNTAGKTSEEPSHDRPARRRGTRIPARARIMGWLLLVLVVVLTAVVLLARQFLHNDVRNRVTAALEQEVGEFVNFARTGRDPATGGPITSPTRLFESYLKRQYPDAPEALIGVWETPAGPRSLPQAQSPRTKALARDPAILRQIVDAPRNFGTVSTPDGPMRWIKVSVAPDGNGRAWFVTAYLPASEIAEVDQSIRMLLLISAFGVVLAALASWVVAGAILDPIRQVRQTAAEIGERDLTRRIPVEGRDDIAALAEQFNAMLDRLEDAFSTQRQFVDDASHELRTPITIVRGHLELLGDDPAEREEVTRLCTDELDRMTRIVEDLLVLAKADRLDFVTRESVSLAELTSDIEAKARSIGDRRWVLDGIGEGEVTVDPQRLTQAMIQLAQNAVQHTDPGTSIRVGSSLDSDRVSLWVTDNGPGVDPDEVENIFERFSHGRGRRGGVGLGLAIVKAIADAHQGRVRVRSEPGRGATFILELPVAPTKPSEESTA